MTNHYVVLGIIGSVTALMGNLPQIFHLLKIKNSTGQSIVAWIVWLFASVMLLVYALSVKEPLFIFLNAGWTILCLVIIFLIIKYKKPRGKKC
jgi:uncharacterized protein with PQ loop repeat